MIPDGVSFELVDFENFFDTRKEYLREKIKALLC